LADNGAPDKDEDDDYFVYHLKASKNLIEEPKTSTFHDECSDSEFFENGQEIIKFSPPNT